MGLSQKRINIIHLIIILAISIFTLYTIPLSKFIGGTNDMEVQAYQMWFLKDSLVNYYKIPSWTSDFFGGKPFLSIYQPLTYFVALPLSLIIGGFWTPKMFILIISLLSTLFFYLLAKKIFKNNWIILIATLVYIAFPHRLRLFGGGSMAQFLATMFVPLVFYIYELYKENPRLKYLSLIGLFCGLSLLSHHAVGGPLLFSIVLIGSYDYFIEKNRIIFKLIPFLILGIMISLVFLIPAYQIQETLNFSITEKSGELFRPFSYLSLLTVGASRGGGEFIGILGFTLFLFSIPSLRKKRKFNKYFIVSLVLLLIGLHFHFLIPNFIKGTLQGSYRFMSILGTSLSLGIAVGVYSISKYIYNILNKYNILNLENKNLNYKNKFRLTIIILLLILLLGSYLRFRPEMENDLQIPEGVLKFYKEVSKDKEYYRIEDQAFAPFGTTPIIHKHGILNGAPMQEAPKYHFFFWSMSWSLLKSEPGIYNFAGLYGTLSIKYLLFKDKVEIPYLKKIKEGKDYVIYKNEKVLDYIRLVPNIVSINAKEPNHIALFYDLLNKNLVPFDKIGFIRSNELKSDVNFNRSLNGKIEILEREPGYLKLNLNDIKERTYLVVAESYHPYWKAKQDEKELKIYEGVPSTLIIPIEKNGIIEIKYTPLKIRFILFLLSLFIIFSLIGIIIYDIRNERKNK